MAHQTETAADDVLVPVPPPAAEKPLAQRALKRLLVSRVSPVRGYLEEVDALRAEARALRAEGHALRADRDSLQAEKEGLVAEGEHLRSEIGRLEEEVEKQRTWVPNGHFYSPLPNLKEVRSRSAKLFDRSMLTLPAIDLNTDAQLELLQQSVPMYAEADFVATETEGKRYYYENDQFPFSDAFFLYFIMRHFRPKRILEVGSGYSSSVMMDTNDRHFDSQLELTFIEPYPERLLRLMRDTDHEKVTLVEKKCQWVSPEVYGKLEAGDIFFIDSSHVSKTGSDVNHLLFEVLPSLPVGVLVHIHDVPFPFEYGPEWVYEGRAWNEAYLVRAFLQYNKSFEVLLFPSQVVARDPGFAEEHMPLCQKTLGPSLWLRKIAD